MVQESQLEIKAKSHVLSRAADFTRDLHQYLSDYLMNLFRMLDGRVPVDFRTIGRENKLVCVMFDELPRKNYIINARILDLEDGKYE